ncbi:hypothetical protein DFA_12182 [Cavenderia fasciculata]|uniref:Uncharacterized protein n=1 Tax=Cavenderia fasciculata TaxID=261658 RepID=F4QCI2_CACFS|nr:uncharacterized protein DFA_12182 [Cavenderia fasciculata]EGG14410.1 hypothetical protein DFA_12182 [Cavenderia fasciculata]|eukprot:XP_004353819.1 hypothetical protein DFA_12182 [Cavenderia fasciculata]
MIKLTKINNVIVEPIKLPQPPKNVKGSELFNQLNANILVCAPKNSGKTVVIKKIIDECTNKQTNVLIFCATVHNDHSWLEIQKDLDKRGITFMAFTSIYDDKANVLEAFIQSLQVKPNENSKSLILTNNIVAEKSSSKKEVAPDYLIIFDDLSNELKDPSITKLMKIQRHFSTKIIISTQSWKDTSSHIRKEKMSRRVWISNDGACIHTGLGGQQGDGFGDWFKKAYDFVKENKLISRGAKALGDAGVPYASKIGEVADKLGYGKKPRRKRTQAGGTQYGINGGAKRKRGPRKKKMTARFVDLLNEFEDVAIGQVDELTITDQLVLENTTNQIIFGDLQVILNVDTTSQSTIDIPSIGSKKVAQVVLTEIDQTINGHKTFSDSLKVDKSIESNEMKTNTITPQSGVGITINGTTTVNNLEINGKVSMQLLDIANIECESLATNKTTGETINIAAIKSLFINAPSVETNQLSFVNLIPGYIPTPLDFYEYYTHWVQFKYNLSGGSYVYSYNQIHIVRIGKLVTLCVDSPPTFTMHATAQASEVYTDIIIPERFRPPNIQIVTVSTYQKQSPTLFIHPCRICCMLDGQLIIQNSDGSGIPCDANQSFSIDPFSMSYVCI